MATPRSAPFLPPLQGASDNNNEHTGRAQSAIKRLYVEKFGEPRLIGFRDVERFKTDDFDGGKLWSLTLPMARYPCITQKPQLPGPKAQPDELWVGENGAVNLWYKGDTVNFAAHADGYPTPQHAVYAAKQLWQAAQTWNSIKVGVQFKWVSTWAEADFALAYGGDKGGVLAEAFFPNDTHLNTLFVYKRAFDQDTINYQPNIFEHELGHVLGLRHEFAANEGGAVIFGPSNPNSVMSYNFPPVIQQTDSEWTVQLYNFADNTIGNLPVQHHHPNQG